MSSSKSGVTETGGEDFGRIFRHLERFEDVWTQGQPVPLEELLLEVEEADRPELFRHALGVELAYRRRRGEPATAEEYLGRFPEFASAIGSAFAEETTGPVPPGITLSDSAFDKVADRI